MWTNGYVLGDKSEFPPESIGKFATIAIYKYVSSHRDYRILFSGTITNNLTMEGAGLFFEYFSGVESPRLVYKIEIIQGDTIYMKMYWQDETNTDNENTEIISASSGYRAKSIFCF